MDIFQLIRLNEKDDFFSAIDQININMVNEFKQNLLHEAVGHGSNKIGRELIKRGINVNHQERNGQTPLHYSALHKNYELARCILENGGDVNIRDVHGNNALWTAVFNAKGDYKMVELFLEFGGDVYTKNKYGRSPFDFAKQIKSEALIKLLSL